MSDALAQFANFTDDQIVGAFMRARDGKKKLVTEQEAALKPFDEAMSLFSQVMLARLADRGAQNTKTAHGTAYKQRTVSATIDDRDAFLNYVRDKGAWSLLTNHVSKETVSEIIELTGSPPPGVKVSEVIKVNFTKG